MPNKLTQVEHEDAQIDPKLQQEPANRRPLWGPALNQTGSQHPEHGWQPSPSNTRTAYCNGRVGSCVLMEIWWHNSGAYARAYPL